MSDNDPVNLAEECETEIRLLRRGTPASPATERLLGLVAKALLASEAARKEAEARCAAMREAIEEALYAPATVAEGILKDALAAAKDGPIMCDECGKYPADFPSKLCAGCEAYKEHQWT